MGGESSSIFQQQHFVSLLDNMAYVAIVILLVAAAVDEAAASKDHCGAAEYEDISPESDESAYFYENYFNESYYEDYKEYDYDEAYEEYLESIELEEEDHNPVQESMILEMVSLMPDDFEARITFNRLKDRACQIDSTIHTQTGRLFFDQNGAVYPSRCLPTIYLVDGRQDCLGLVEEKGNVSVKFIGAIRGPGVVISDITERIQYHELNNRCIVIMDRTSNKNEARRKNNKGQQKKKGAILDRRIPPKFRANPFVTVQLKNFVVIAVSMGIKNVPKSTTPSHWWSTTTTTTTTATTATKRGCDTGSNDHLAYETDCRAFYHCSHEELVIKYCGPGTLFNPLKKICDHPYQVYKIKPECRVI